MNIENLLTEEIKDELETLKKMEVGSDKYKSAVEGITKLVDRAIELEKIEVNCQEKEADREHEAELKLRELNDEKKSKTISALLNLLGIAVPAGLTIWGTFKTFKFEETGTITTQAGRNFINKLFKK